MSDSKKTPSFGFVDPRWRYAQPDKIQKPKQTPKKIKIKIIGCIIGLVGFFLLKYTIEPCLIETACKELINCKANQL